MDQIDWLQMLSYQYELHCFSRALLAKKQKQTLTNSERELLSRLYLKPEENTPLALSKSSGMKKEAISRCLKNLLEKGCIQRAKSLKDERSYILSLTEQGQIELKQNYGAILQPLYDLRRRMGSEFDTLCKLIQTANQHTDVPQETTELK